MEVIKWIVENIDNIILIVVAIIALCQLIKHSESEKLKQSLLYLVTQAEIDFGSGTGTLKSAVVADWLYQRIPSSMKVLFSSKDIQKMIEDVLVLAKKKWESNSNLQSIIQANSTKIATAEEIKQAVATIAEAAIRSKDDENL